MRLSRPRVLLRAALLLTGGAFMVWRAQEAWRAARAAAPGAADAQLLSRVAVVEALVALLAFGAAALALLALRPRRRGHTLRLSDLPPRGPPPVERPPRR